MDERTSLSDAPVPQSGRKPDYRRCTVRIRRLARSREEVDLALAAGFEALARLREHNRCSRRLKLSWAAHGIRSWAIGIRLWDETTPELVRVANRILRCSPFGGPTEVTLREKVAIVPTRQCTERICPHCHIRRLVDLVKKLEAWVEKDQITTLTVLHAETALRQGEHFLPLRESLEHSRKHLMKAASEAGNPAVMAFGRILPARTVIRYRQIDGQRGVRAKVPAWVLINTLLVFSDPEHPFQAFKHPVRSNPLNFDTGPVHNRLRVALTQAGRIPVGFYRPARFPDAQEWLNSTFKLQSVKTTFKLEGV